MKKLKWIAGGIVVFLIIIVVIAVAAGCGSGDEAKVKATATPMAAATAVAKQASQQMPAATAAAPTLAVSAKQLMEAYTGNQIAADQKYKGKIVRVTGKVAGVASGGYAMPGIAYVTLEGNVLCTTNSADISILASLQKGQVVTVKGRFDGMAVAMFMLNECSIQ